MSDFGKIKKWWQELLARWNAKDPTPVPTPDPVPVPDPVTPPISSSLPTIGSATISGWGPVNMHWKMSEAELESCFVRMQQKNVRFFGVEAVGNANEDVLVNSAKLAQVKSRLLFEAKQCHGRGIWFNVIVANDNAGDGGYQNGGYTLQARLAQYTSFMDWIAENLAPYKSCIIITPVAETQTSAGKSLESHAAKVFAGWNLCANTGSRPTKPASWSKFYCFHPTSTGQWPNKDAIVLSDCGSTIRALNIGGDINGKSDPAKVKAWLAEGVKRGQAVVAVYGFQCGADLDAIDALERPAANSQPSGGTNEPTQPTVDEADFSAFKWDVGGVNGTNAKLDTPRISELKFKGTKELTLHWDTGLSSWGYEATQADGIACLFLQHNDGTYRGGKFEWISTSRSQRDLDNIYGKKYFFDLSDVPNPCKAAFVVLSKDKTRRSNVIAGEWKR